MLFTLAVGAAIGAVAMKLYEDNKNKKDGE